MITAYIMVGIVLLLLWIGGMLILAGEVFDGHADKTDFQMFAAVFTVSLFCVFVWPLVIPVALGSFLCYGSFQAVRYGYKIVRGQDID